MGKCSCYKHGHCIKPACIHAGLPIRVPHDIYAENVHLTDVTDRYGLDNIFSRV